MKQTGNEMDEADLEAIASLMAIGAAMACAGIALVAATLHGFWLAWPFILVGGVYAQIARYHGHRADSLTSRSLAADLAEEGPVVLAEAA